MDAQEALNKAVEVADGDAHQDYDRTVEYRKKLTAFSSGEDLTEFIQKYFPDSDEEEVKKIEALTQSITPAIFNKILQPVQKSTRSDIVKRVESESEINDYINTYYGKKSLSDYLDTRWLSTYIHDPNAFEVVEWGDFDNIKGKAEPYPDIIACDHIYNFKIVNEEIKWLMVHTPDTQDYTFYAPGYVIKLSNANEWEIDAELEQPEGGKYSIQFIETGIEEITANRIGNVTDIKTNHRTCISLVHPALPRMEKMLKVGAEVDFAFNLHAMVKKSVYVQKCSGDGTKGCIDGCTTTGDTCNLCKGTGKMTTTSSKDMMEYAMPKHKEDLIDLDSLYHYEEVPRGIIDLELEYQKYLEDQCFKDVYNSTVLQDYAGEKTATEVSIDYEGIKDKLIPFEIQYSDSFVWHVERIAEIREDEIGEVICQFPMNLELEPTRQLILNRKNIDGCPSYVVNDHDMRLAERIYRDSPMELKKFKIKMDFMPFSGKDLNTIKYIRSQGYINEVDIALYDNYELIWRELEEEDLDLYEKDKKAIKELIYAKAEGYLSTEITLPNVGLEGDI